MELRTYQTLSKDNILTCFEAVEACKQAVDEIITRMK